MRRSIAVSILSGLVGVAVAVPTSFAVFFALLLFGYVLQTHPGARYLWGLSFPFLVIGSGALVGGYTWTGLAKHFLGSPAGGRFALLRHVIAMTCGLAGDAIIFIGPLVSWFPLIASYQTPQAYLILCGPSIILVIVLGLLDGLLLSRYRTPLSSPDPDSGDNKGVH